MLKALKVRLYPTTEQVDFINQQFGAVRLVYNKGLAIISHEYRRHQRSLKATKDIKPLLVVAKKSRKYCWLKHYDAIALQESCRNLDTAFTNFFQKRAGYPTFKKRHAHQSSYHCTGISLGDNWIKVPKLKTRIKAKIHRKLDGRLKSITLSRTPTGKYYASLLLNMNEEAMKPATHVDANLVLGLDVGISHLLSDSKGCHANNPRHLQLAQKNIRRKQKSLSRKQKGSHRRAKARLLVAKCHEKVSQTRNDFQHKLTKRLIDENQAVVVETLKIKNMMKNHKLSKHIADASWHGLLTKLRYKALSSGKYYVEINQWFASSKTCSCCGHKLEALPLSIRAWDCPQCHTHHDRDLNAALNIKAQGLLKLKAEGLSVSANGGLRKTDHASAVA